MTTFRRQLETRYGSRWSLSQDKAAKLNCSSGTFLRKILQRKKTG